MRLFLHTCVAPGQNMGFTIMETRCELAHLVQSDDSMVSQRFHDNETSYFSEVSIFMKL